MGKGNKKNRAVEVAPASSMDVTTFLRHFNRRHMPLAGLTSLEKPGIGLMPSFLDPEEGALRAYHRRVHRLQQHNIVDGHTHPRELEAI